MDAVRVVGLFLVGSLIISAYSDKKALLMSQVPDRTEEIMNELVLNHCIT